MIVMAMVSRYGILGVVVFSFIAEYDYPTITTLHIIPLIYVVQVFS